MAVLRTTTLSLGPKLEEFEDRLAEAAGTGHAIAVNSGTSALHLIVRAMGIGPGDEVITTPFSFVASSNSVLFERATPVFVDIEPHTYNIDPARVEAAITPQTRAILAVDVFGHPADWDLLRELAVQHSLWHIEDSAEAIGSRYKGNSAGSLGDAGIFSFYPNKQMTTGEGGAVVTDDTDVARLCRSMRNQGRGDGDAWLQHERLGFNYRLSEINCALGIAQIDRLGEIKAARSRVAQMYRQRLHDTPGIHLPCVSPDVDMSWFVYVIRLDDAYEADQRDRVVQELREAGIGSSVYFPAIHHFPFYRETAREGSLPVTEAVSARTIAIPFHNHLSFREVNLVAEALERVLARVPAAQAVR